MEIRVKHEELNQVSNKIKNDSEEYDIEIEKMLKEINNLREIWHGEDAEIFCDNFYSYIEKMKNITNAMNNMSNVINVANKGYKDIDEEFAEALNEEANDYE